MAWRCYDMNLTNATNADWAERARLTPTAQAGGGPTAQAQAYASRAR